MGSNRYEIIREAADGLSRSVWIFWYFDNRHALVLDSYVELSRPSRRHKYTISGKHYERLSHRDGANCGSKECPLPEDVVNEARAKFVEALAVERWERQ